MGRVFLTAEWRNLALLSFPIDAAVLAALVLVVGANRDRDAVAHLACDAPGKQRLPARLGRDLAPRARPRSPASGST